MEQSIGLSKFQIHGLEDRVNKSVTSIKINEISTGRVTEHVYTLEM